MEISDEVLARLWARAPELAPLAAHRRPKKIRGRPPGFATLVQIVVEQAVSQRSAEAVWARLRAAAPEVGPRALLALEETGLRSCGLSGGKALCVLGAAEAIQAGDLDLAALEHAPDDEVRSALTRLKGIGRWTADIYLLIALRRPDVWPAHDLALQEALRELRGLEVRPDAKQTDAYGEKLRPHRSAATVLLWERYLASRSSSAKTTRSKSSAAKGR